MDKIKMGKPASRGVACYALTALANCAMENNDRHLAGNLYLSIDR